MINALIAWSLRNRWAVLLIALGLSLYGAFGARRMPVDVFPDLTAPMVTVIVEGHGMAPEEMERLATLPLETAVNGVAQVRRVRSATAVGIAVIWVEFNWGTDIYRARQTVTERIAAVSAALPQDVEPPVLAPISSMMGEILFVGLTSEAHDPMELRNIAEARVIRPLLAVDGVSQAVPIGGDVQQFQVLLSPQLMQSFGLGIEDVHRALRESNANTSAGFLIEGGEERLLRGVGRLRNHDDVASVEVEHRDGRSIQVGDLGVVQLGPALKRGTASVAIRSATGEAKIRDSVVIAIQKQPTANTLELTQRLDGVFDALQESLPAGVELQRGLFSQASFIEASIANTTSALVEGAAMVVLVVVVFLASLQASFIALLAIPLSLLSALLVLWGFGVSMNTMTLGGMAIAIGALVDDAIIDVENVMRRLRENRARPIDDRLPALQVIYAASAEVRASIVLATCIILLVFTPLFFLSGVEGRLLLPLGVAFCVALAASLVTALTVTPALCAFLLPKSRAIQQHREPALVATLKRWYSPTLRFALRHPALVSLPALALFIWAAVEFSRLGKNFLPEFNEGAMVVGVVTLPGTSLEQSDQLARLAEARLIAHPEVVAMARRTGRAEADEHVQGVEASEFEITLDMNAPAERGLPVRSRAELLAAMRADLSQLPGIQASFGQPISHRVDHMLSGTRASIAVKIFGPELAQLRSLASRVEETMGPIDGVVDLSTEQQIEVPQTRVLFDRDALARYGVSLQAASHALQATSRGVEATEIVQGQQSYDVVVRWQPDSQTSHIDVSQVRVRSTTGEWVPLGLLAEIVRDVSPNMISRENVQRKIVVMCNVAGRDVHSVVGDIRRAIEQSVELPDLYSVEYGGQFETATAANRRLAVLGSLAVIGIGLLLLARFRSLRDVLLIMLNLPLALIGGVLGVVLSGGIVSIASIIGFVSVFGIAARNGIMLVSHVRHLQREEGVRDFHQAVYQGSLERLAPILMTAISAALALIPLALRGDDPGTEILTPMAIVILYGLLSSTVLNMLVVPALLLRFSGPQARPTSAAAAVLLAASCVQVQPDADYDAAAELIEQRSGVSASHDFRSQRMSDAEAQALLADGLTLAEARRLCLAYHPRLRAEFLNIGVAHAERVQAGLLENPSLDLVLRWPLEGGARVLEAALAMELSQLWQLSDQEAVAIAELDATVLHVARQALLELAAVQQAYIAVVRAEEIALLDVELFEVHQRRGSLMDQSQAAGAVDRHEWLNARAELQDVQLALRTSQWNAEQARVAFARSIGWGGDPMYIEFSADASSLWSGTNRSWLDPDLRATLGLVLEQRLDLRALELTCELLEAQVKWEDGQGWSGLGAGVAYESPGEGSDELGPTVSLPLPIFDQNQAQQAKAGTLLEQARLQQAAARAEVQQDVRLAWRKSQLADQLWKFYRDEIIPLAENSFNLAEQAVEQGRDSVESLVSAEIALLDVKRRAVEQRWEAVSAALSLRRELGDLKPAQ